MHSKATRTALITLAAITATTASLLLITALAAAQPVAPDVSRPVNGPRAAGGLAATQSFSVTFLGNTPRYAPPGFAVHPIPPQIRHPAELCAIVVNHDSSDTYTATVEFGVAPFGIGLTFHPVGEATVEVPPSGDAAACVVWVPDEPVHHCFQAVLRVAGFDEQVIWHNLDVDEPLQASVSHARSFVVSNPTTETQVITLAASAHLGGWEVTLSHAELLDVGPGDERTVVLTVTPPADMPGGWTPVADVEGYINGELIGGFLKIYRPPILLHRFPDPPYAEREISINPYPVRAGEPTELCVELRNPTDQIHDVTAYFSWAQFGIGMPFYPINGPRPVSLPPHSLVRECIHWIPPVEDQVCIEVELHMDGYTPQRSRRNLDVNEPLEPLVSHSRTFPVRNPTTGTVTITLGLVPHMPDWELTLSPDTFYAVPPETTETFTLTVKPPADLPEDGAPIVDVEAYIAGEMIGGFRKIFRPPVPIHRPRDPIYAESEIFVHPYPPRLREPTEVGAEIRNPTEDVQTVTVSFSAAPFGIGLEFKPINNPMTITIPPGGLVRPATVWTPPGEGLWCFQVEIEIPGHDEVYTSQRNIDVGEPLAPDTPHGRLFPVRNPFGYPVTITLGLVPHLPGWGLSLSQDVLPDVPPGEVREVELVVTPPADLPPDGAVIVDVEAYAEGTLIGGFRKLFRPPVPIHRPRDPVYAETEIGVDPYPVIPGHPTKLSVEVFNPTPYDHVVTATFAVARFGIGVPFTTTGIAPNPIQIYVPAAGAARGHVVWTPPPAAHHYKACVQVTLELEDHEPVWSRRNIDVGEPLEPGAPHALVFPVGGWPYTETVTVTLGLVVHREDWEFELSPDVFDVDPGATVSVTLTVTPANDAELGTGDPIVDVEGYVEGELIGGFRKLDVPPVPIHKPHEKGYAESEISIDPYPPQQGQPTTISTVVQNSSEATMTINLEFGWADFGMGIPFTTTGVVSHTQAVTLPPHSTATVWTTWVPSQSGHQCVRILLSDAGGEYAPQESQRNVDVTENPYCGTNVYTITVYNDSPFTSTLDVGLMTFNVPPNWEVTTIPSSTLELPPYTSGVIKILVKILCTKAPMPVQGLRAYSLLEEPGENPIIDVEGYIDGELVGGVELRFSGEAEWPHQVYLPLVMRAYP